MTEKLENQNLGLINVTLSCNIWFTKNFTLNSRLLNLKVTIDIPHWKKRWKTHLHFTELISIAVKVGLGNFSRFSYFVCWTIEFLILCLAFTNTWWKVDSQKKLKKLKKLCLKVSLDKWDYILVLPQLKTSLKWELESIFLVKQSPY